MRQEIPQIQNPTYPPKKNVALNIVGTKLIGMASFAWSRPIFLRQGELTDKYKMLNLIAVSNLAPIGRKNEILLDMTCLLYTIGKGHSIDLPSLILTEIKKGCDMKRNSLPFGTLVTQICKDHGIRVRPEMTIQKPMGPLNKASFRRSQGHSGGPAASQEEPPTQGVDEV